MNSRAWYQRSAVATAPPANEQRPVYADHRMDFLTMVLADGSPEFAAYEVHQQESPVKRSQARAAHVKAGMTRYLIGVCGDGFDEIGSPDRIVPVLQELWADGLGVSIAVCPEDSPAMQAKYGNIPYFINTLRGAMTVWRPWLSEVWLGVEADEVWTPSQILTITEGIRSFQLPIVLHLGQGHVLPRGTTDPRWWATAASAGITALAYQAMHPAVEDAGGAFLADLNGIRAELRHAVQTVAGRVTVLSSEYAYFGINPRPATVRTVSEAAYALGEKSLEEAGVTGISNGGPGYWPPEPLKPPIGAVDEIDVQTVNFYDRSGKVINEIRNWPIESRCTPGFPDSRHVSYEHSATLSWPIWDEDGDGKPDAGGVNANSWIGLYRNRRWEAYTNDFLRPGSCTKVWADVNSFAHEPITWGPPKPGEELYLFTTRIARYGTFPTGAGRSNLVKVVCP